MPLLSLEKVSWTYDGERLLKEIDLDLESGEILCLLGPSGSGKTSLLRMVAGLETPDSGAVRLNGVDLRDTPAHRRQFGMMFQEFALFPHKNVFQNVAFGLEVRKIGKAGIAARVLEMLSLVGLSGFEKRRVEGLSGGERQRVALARSLAPEPKLLMLDEPLGSLDRELRDRLAADVRQILKKVGVTAIFVTHDHGEAFAVADRVALLNAGRLEQIDTPEDLYRHPKTEFVARFLGFKNRLKAEIIAPGNIETHAGSLSVDTKGIPVGETRILVLRPECARVADSRTPVVAPGCRINGTIAGRRFEGRLYQVDVQMGEGMLTFDLANHPTPPGIGEAIALDLQPQGMVFLPKEEGS
jgi:ABC-type Fe3+/spermidine/putrescine transport system ATPase subunit